MKRFNRLCFVCIIIFLVNAALPAQNNEQSLLEKAKLLIFDKKWDEATALLNQFTKNYPESKYYSLATFFKAKCYEEQKMFHKALDTYKSYLIIAKNKSLIEESTIAIIDICFDLYQKGEKKHLKKIIDYLKSSQRTIRYYAAFKLSYVKDKNIAAKGVPILKKMMDDEADEELRDRAKIALLRIDPRYLTKTAKERRSTGTTLKIRVTNRMTKKFTFSINIPLVLAKLALEALPEKEKAELRREGYNLDRILKKLTETGELLRFETEEEIITIWIE